MKKDEIRKILKECKNAKLKLIYLKKFNLITKEQYEKANSLFVSRLAV